MGRTEPDSSARPAILDLSHTPLPALIQANLVAYMRLFAGLPGMVMHDADTFWFVSHRPAPGDTILRTRWPDGDVAARIDATLAAIGWHLNEVGWMLFPGDQPAGLGKMLAARGMPGGPGGYWLWADLTRPSPAPVAPAGFRLVPVRDDRALTEWVRLSEAGFGCDLACYYDAYARHGYGPEAFSFHYLGYHNDTPVASGTLLDAGGSAALYDISTPPAYRRQGFGRALTHALLQEIHARGHASTWIWSSEMARSLYKDLGFVEADFGVREHRWRRA